MSYANHILLLFVIACAKAAYIIICGPAYSRSHLMSNGRIADTLATAGHNVVIFIPEYQQMDFNCTKHARVIKMSNVYEHYDRLMNDFVASLFAKHTMSTADHLKWAQVSADVCESIPTPLSYVPVVEESGLSSAMTFLERAYNLFLYVSMFLPFQFFQANCVGYQSFQSLMLKGERGVVLMSLGTLVPSSSIPSEIRTDILKVFGESMEYHFLIRVDDSDDETRQLLEDMHLHNVELVGWMPQSDILGHARLKLFIMHGGLNGMLEAAIRGVPVLVIPFFADRFHNAITAETRGIGLSLQKHELNYKHLKDALTELLENDKYSQAAPRLSAVIRNKPNKPEEQLIKWTTFVAEYGSFPELQVEGAKFGFIKYFGIDILATVLAALLTFVMITVFAMRQTISYLRKAADNRVKKAN